MKFRKSIILLLLVTLLVGLVACKKNDNSGENLAGLNPGTYEAIGKGNNGDILVEVSFDQESILEVKVKDHNETEGIGNKPIDLLPLQIVENQSILIDTIAGATMTSNGILEGVKDCILQAGGKVENFEKELGKIGKKSEKELTTDILVIGGGGTGLSAAASAKENGASVIVLEKLANVGGSTALSGGGISATGTRFQKELGIEDSKDLWKDLWMERQETSNQKSIYPDYERLDKFMDQAVDTTHWLVDKIGHKYSSVEGFGFDPFPRLHFPEGGMGSVITGNIENYLKENSVDILTETEAKELIIDEKGQVIGAIAEDRENIFKITSKKVILASGGFAKNEELLKRFIPEMEGTSDLSAASVGSTGDGIIMAENIGADLYDEAWVIGLGITSKIKELSILDWDTTKILVNRRGERFFNEASHYAIVTNKVAEENGAWMILDSKGGSKETMDLIDSLVDEKELFKGESIEELAGKINIETDKFKSTIDEFNLACEKGVDKFEKNKEMLVPIKTGPYYGVRMYPKTMGTFGGVKTDDNFRVLKKDGSIIENLYAGGECSNKIYYNQVYMSGSAVQLALTSGRISGEHAAKSLK